MARKAEIALTYRISDIDVSIRYLGKLAQLGEAEVKANWAYEIKQGKTKLFSGANLFTGDWFSHGMAVAQLLKLHTPVDGVVPAWFDTQTMSNVQMRWFLGGWKIVQHALGVTNVSYAPDVMFVRGDGSVVPFDEDGMPRDASTLGQESEGTKYIADVRDERKADL